MTLFLILASCASYPPNAHLAKYDRTYGYRFANIAATPGQDETFVILAFSGGGTRAAALAYGVLGELAKTKIHGGAQTLLDEVDAISSVSGGSFTAAAYALAGHMPLEAFERDFLRHDVQGDLFRAALNPRNWPRLLSPHFSRIDLAAEYYDAHVFAHKTFADVPHRRPYLILNATEADLGSRFEFTQEQFDPICSDLGPMKVARGVAASSAYPVLLTMEYIRVTYPESRTVYIDGEENGDTGAMLRVEEGRHTINLGDPRDYTPKWRRPVVTGTNSRDPMVIEFERA